MNIDFDELRKDLMDYYGTAKEINPMAIMDLIDIEKATDSELIMKARLLGVDLSNYEDDYPKTRRR